MQEFNLASLDKQNEILRKSTGTDFSEYGNLGFAGNSTSSATPTTILEISGEGILTNMNINQSHTKLTLIVDGQTLFDDKYVPSQNATAMLTFKQSIVIKIGTNVPNNEYGGIVCTYLLK